MIPEIDRKKKFRYSKIIKQYAENQKQQLEVKLKYWQQVKEMTI